ncbi:MAG: long-chain fatty acid--CoA ligase, partial [Chloroflexota bacterium]
VDAATGKDCPSGAIGEIAIQSQVMLGYWNKPEETARVMLDSKWFLTGDLGKMDVDRFFTVVDRKKDMSSSAGSTFIRAKSKKCCTSSPKCWRQQPSAFPI